MWGFALAVSFFFFSLSLVSFLYVYIHSVENDGFYVNQNKIFFTRVYPTVTQK